MDTEQIKDWLKLRLSEEKYRHSLGAEETARVLARMFGADEEKAALAGLIHDNAKDINYEELLQLIKINNFDIPEKIQVNKKIIHAFAGACLAKKELGINDIEVLNAISYHTTGRTDMTILEKVVYMADKIEPRTREASFRDEVWSILNETNNINNAILFCIDRTIRSLLDRKLIINPLTVEIWNSSILSKNFV